MRSDLLASPRTPRRLLALLARAGAGALVLMSLSSAARADDRASAQALFDAGKLLVADGKYAEACPKFEASFTLDRTLGTLLNLADCHEKVGKVATGPPGACALRAARTEEPCA
ncbi:MAG: hypothetical protein WKG00_41925, partial [Polyangiaceae bacterium]